MKKIRFSVRARLTAWYGGLFFVAGAILVVITCLLVNGFLPQATSFGIQITAQDPHSTTISGTGSSSNSSAQISADPQLLAQLNNYRNSVLFTVATQAIIALLITVIIAVAFGWVMATRILRPIHAITATARKLSAENLDQRLAITGPNDELKELADTFDSMLDRLAASFESQRRFVANASHELRTPLAVQRTLTEVAMTAGDTSPKLRQLCENLLTVNKRNEQLIEGLLTLARSEQGLRDKQPVRFDRIVSGVTSSFAELAVEHTIEVHQDINPRIVSGDPVLLERLVTNLVQNAIRYNEPRGWMRIKVQDHPALTIENSSPAVPPDVVSTLFEPFRRLSADRARGTGGVGLGLSIVRAIAQAHDGSVTAQSSTDGFGIIVEFP